MAFAQKARHGRAVGQGYCAKPQRRGDLAQEPADLGRGQAPDLELDGAAALADALLGRPDLDLVDMGGVGGTLAGTITLTAGLGGMGGAQPLAVTMNDGVAICVDVDQSRITRRIEHRYLDEVAAFEEALTS